MKKLTAIAFLAVLLLPTIAFGQAEPKFVYCQIIVSGNAPASANNMKVTVDFGQKMQLFGNNKLKDENGKAIRFNSIIDAMNHLSYQGWEFVQTYVSEPTTITTAYQFTVMKKLFSDLDEETKKEYLKK